MYTVTADRSFVIDVLEGAPNILIVYACSGHGFKHSVGASATIAKKVPGPGQPLRSKDHRATIHGNRPYF